MNQSADFFLGTVLPPSSNTGAQITSPLPVERCNRVLIDFASLTFLHINDPAQALQIIGLSESLFCESPIGALGYKKVMRFGNISVYYDGSQDMGVHVSMTGQGCRQYEAQFTCNPWLWLIENTFLHNGQFTRLDIAIDNFDGQLDLTKLKGAIDDGKIRSRFKRGRRIAEFAVSSNGPVEDSGGETIYFGSSKSRLQCRFYDKAAEQKIDDLFWVRAELQLRAERANEAAKKYLSGITLPVLASGVINNYVTPIEHDDSNVSRCSTQAWWLGWLENTSKLALTVAKAVKYVQQVMDNVKRQYAPTIAMISQYLGVGFIPFIREIVKDGTERMSMRHAQILAVSQ